MRISRVITDAGKSKHAGRNHGGLSSKKAEENVERWGKETGSDSGWCDPRLDFIRRPTRARASDIRISVFLRARCNHLPRPRACSLLPPPLLCLLRSLTGNTTVFRSALTGLQVAPALFVKSWRAQVASEARVYRPNIALMSLM